MDVNKQLKQVFVSVVESILHFFKVHRKVILGNPSVVVKNVLGKTPEPLNAVNVVFGLTVNHSLLMRKRVVFAEPLQGVVASERVGVIDRAFSGFLADNGHQFFFGNMLHYSRIYLAIPLQKAKNNVFACGTPTAPAFASAAKIAFVHLYFAIQSAAFKLGYVVNCLTQALVYAGNRLVITAQIMSQAVCRLLLVKALDDGNLHANFPKRFLFSTGPVAATHVSTSCSMDPERTAKYALPTPQKVGRTAENVVSSCNHKDILTPRGYETH